MRTLKISLAAILLGAVISSCSKTGPAGPEGPAGPAGANGAANVYMTDFSINPSQWSSYNSTTWDYVANVDVATTDVVNVYISLNGTSYTPLTQNSLFYSGDELTYAYGNGAGLTLWYYFSSLAPDYTLYVKIADIPPAIFVKHPNTNWNNYNEVAALPEVKLAGSVK